MLLGTLLESYFTRLRIHTQASPHTVNAYRTAVVSLVLFTEAHLKKNRSMMRVADITDEVVVAWLHKLGTVSKNSPQTVNARLAAVKSIFKFTEIKYPDYMAQSQQIRYIAMRKAVKKEPDYLTIDEMKVLIRQPDINTFLGKRDTLILQVLCQTAMRASEVTKVTKQDLQIIDGEYYLRCLGKGRKIRDTPLFKKTGQNLVSWAKQNDIHEHEPLFGTIRGKAAMSDDTLARLIKKHVATAIKECPSLAKKNITPHTFRHGTATALFTANADSAGISGFMGHASLSSIDSYRHSSPAMKRKALSRLPDRNLTAFDFEQLDQKTQDFLKNL